MRSIGVSVCQIRSSFGSLWFGSESEFDNAIEIALAECRRQAKMMPFRSAEHGEIRTCREFKT
jgi:hypothetical protein